MKRIILTTDKTLASDYNGSEFLGFAACSPTFLPTFLFEKIFCPPLPKENGRAKFANCGVRKIEAALLQAGFNKEEVLVIRPQDIKKFLNEKTMAIGITTNDPLGLGPASSTFSSLVEKETYSARCFRELLEKIRPYARKYKIKVVVGGPGAWQLEDERLLTKYGIDCLCIGEGEITAVEIFKKIVNNEEIPRIVYGEVVPLEKIPNIVSPTINGLVEIARGCGRGCRFCNPTMLNYRCRELKDILEEVRINASYGLGALLHAEDVLRYKANGVIPREDKVIELFKEVLKIVKVPSKVGISHFTFASALARPNLVKEISELLNVGSKDYPFFSGQVGIETGSPRLAEKYMQGKAKPFDAKEWPSLVREAFKLLAEHNWVPCATLISGLPGEEAEDVVKTIELIEDLKDYKSLIVPLFFVPIGTLRKEKFFLARNMLPEHWQLLAKCIKHNFRWVYTLIDKRPSLRRMNRIKVHAIKLCAKMMERKLRPYLKIMEGGGDPFS